MAVLVRHAMTENPKALSPERTAGDAAGLMAQFDFGAVPVVEGDTVAGIVTDRDLVVRVMAKRRDPTDVTLGEIVTTSVTTVSPDTELNEARDLMEDKRIRRLPVVKDGALVGMLSIGDVAVALASKREVGQALERISESESTTGLNRGPAIGTPAPARRESEKRRSA
jgi:CBS domain-containing protein